MDVEHDISIDNNANINDTLIIDPIIYNALTSTFTLTYSQYSDSLIVTNIDLLLIEGSYHKRYTFSELNSNWFYFLTITYVNGLGFTNLGGFEHGRQLYRYHVNNEQFWGVETTMGGQYYCTVSTEEQTISKISIYPNPTQGNLTINVKKKTII